MIIMMIIIIKPKQFLYVNTVLFTSENEHFPWPVSNRNIKASPQLRENAQGQIVETGRRRGQVGGKFEYQRVGVCHQADHRMMNDSIVIK